MKTFRYRKEIVTDGLIHKLNIEYPIKEYSIYLGDDFMELVLPEEVNDLIEIRDPEDLTVYLYEGYPQIPALFGFDAANDESVDKEYVLKILTSKPGEQLYPVLEKALQLCGGKGDDSNLFASIGNYIPNGEG